MTVDQAIARIQKAQGKSLRNAYAAMRVTMNKIRREVRKRTPRDTGALRRHWQIKRGPRGAELINTRTRARFALKGGAIEIGRTVTTDTIAENKREIAQKFIQLSGF